VRFLLGAAEAGFFPGIILYLSSGLESAEFLRLSHGLILAFVSADPVLGNPIRLA
jgi:hypothetical protein